MRSLRRELETTYRGQTVLVTGHTGFKGAWLCEWLLMLGARVIGIALPPDTTPALFDQLGLVGRMEHHIQDIRERAAFTQRVAEARPDYVFHLAAQPLVRHSYAEPVETFETNVMGTVHMLEGLRALNTVYHGTQKTCAAVFITTDKCYENCEWVYAYREEDALGGYDPYSSSKAASELAIAAYRSSFFHPGELAGSLRVGIASARGGNVIGGGDWAKDRIVPDCIRHLQREEPIPVRNPTATRPWQHVLEPLAGYLRLAMRQREALQTHDPIALQRFCSAYNFGPALPANRPVRALVEQVLTHWPGRWVDRSDAATLHEADRLNLAWDKAFHQLDWRPRWDFSETIQRTVRWYRVQATEKAEPVTLTRADIEAYYAA